MEVVSQAIECMQKGFNQDLAARFRITLYVQYNIQGNVDEAQCVVVDKENLHVIINKYQSGDPSLNLRFNDVGFSLIE